jgi:hypothetical protein
VLLARPRFLRHEQPTLFGELVVLRLLICPALSAAAVALAGAQQSSVSFSPFVSFLPSGSPRPMAGLALTLADGPFALRGGGQISIQDRAPLSATSTNTSTTRPWRADADALVYLQSLTYGDHVTFSPYLFAGIGAAAVDSASQRIRQQGWSYGSGLALPLSSAFGMLGEVRWRVSRFVLPNAEDAPSPVAEARFALVFRVGGGGARADAIPIIAAGEGTVWEGASGPAAIAARVLSTADHYVGTKYRRGGTSPSTGFDAAGFVRFVFARLGVLLPTTSGHQARVGERLRPDWDAIAPGDLVMFQDEAGINHVAIYVGQSRIIHSSETGGGVRYDDLATERGRWFLEHLVAARRITPDLRGLLLDLAREFASEETEPDHPDRAPRVSLRRRR